MDQSTMAEEQQAAPATAIKQSQDDKQQDGATVQIQGKAAAQATEHQEEEDTRLIIPPAVPTSMIPITFDPQKLEENGKKVIEVFDHIKSRRVEDQIVFHPA